MGPLKWPEVVYGERFVFDFWLVFMNSYQAKARYESDVFSIGCILYELLAREPLFVPCENTPHYAYQKCLMFSKILLDVPCDEILRHKHSDWFGANGLLEITDYLSWPVRVFLDDYCPLDVSWSHSPCTRLMYIFRENLECNMQMSASLLSA